MGVGSLPQFPGDSPDVVQDSGFRRFFRHGIRQFPFSQDMLQMFSAFGEGIAQLADPVFFHEPADRAESEEPVDFLQPAEALFGRRRAADVLCQVVHDVRAFQVVMFPEVCPEGGTAFVDPFFQGR